MGIRVYQTYFPPKPELHPIPTTSRSIRCRALLVRPSFGVKCGGFCQGPDTGVAALHLGSWVCHCSRWGSLKKIRHSSVVPGHLICRQASAKANSLPSIGQHNICRDLCALNLFFFFFRCGHSLNRPCTEATANGTDFGLSSLLSSSDHPS